MKYLILTIFLTLALLSSGQQNSDLIACWIDSREENTSEESTSIYRLCDFKEFPALRFRFTMELKENQQCTWLSLAPNDGHLTQEGTWAFEEESKTLRIFNTEQEEVKRFVISSIEKDKLILVN